MRRVELPALTGIRFYAATLVFLSHVGLLPGAGKLVSDHLIFNVGVVGVSFFFVLSGFILTYNYADVFRAGVSRPSYGRFVWDRLTKIYPVHLLATLVVLPIAVYSPNLPFDWTALPVHLLLLQCFWPFATGSRGEYLNVPSWSISCEWFFYLLAPVAMFLALGRRRSLMPILVAALYVVLGWFVWNGQSEATRLHVVSWFAPSRFIEFLAGVFLCRWYLAAPRAGKVWSPAAVQAAGIVLIVAGAVYRDYAPWPLWGGLLYLPGSAVLVFGLTRGDTVLARHLAAPLVRRLGVASYSFYLLHAPMLRALKSVFLVTGSEVGSWAAFGAIAAVTFVAIQVTALIVCSAYELPVQKRLRDLVRKRTVGNLGGVPQPVS